MRKKPTKTLKQRALNLPATSGAFGKAKHMRKREAISPDMTEALNRAYAEAKKNGVKADSLLSSPDSTVLVS